MLSGGYKFINLLKFAEYWKLGLTILPYKNLSCSPPLLQDNKNEVDQGTSKGEKAAASHNFTPQRDDTN